MNLSINKKQFLISFLVLGLSWLSINYFFFVKNGLLCAHPDFMAIINWSWNAKSENFVDIFGNYMPIFPYMAYMYKLCFSNFNQFIENAYLLKSIIILVDIITYSFIISLVKIKNLYQFGIIIFLVLINFSLFYNSIIWGQVDNIHSFLLLLGFYFLCKNKLGLTGMCLTVAIFTKIVSVIFLPVFFLVILNKIIIKEIKLLEVAKMLITILVTTLLIFAPLLLKGLTLDYINTQSIYLKTYDCISGNAFNIWYIITNKTDLILLSDQTYYHAHITFGKLGTLSFSIIYFIVITPILFVIGSNIFKKEKQAIPLKTLILINIIIPIIFFYFTTKIRERYAHPYLLFLTLHCLLNRQYIFMYLGSFIYFLQLESVLKFTNQFSGVYSMLHNETNIYNPIFISSLFLLLIIYILNQLFTTFSFKNYLSNNFHFY